jgi:hypothetical protein
MLTAAEWLALGIGLGWLVAAVSMLVWLHGGPGRHQHRP